MASWCKHDWFPIAGAMSEESEGLYRLYECAACGQTKNQLDISADRTYDYPEPGRKVQKRKAGE